MLVGIVLVLTPQLSSVPVPRWWTKAMALFITCGAAADLFAISSYLRADR